MMDAMIFSDERFVKENLFREGASTTFVLNFKPGQGLPAHKHPKSTVFLHTLEGNGTFIVDGEKVATVKGDICCLNEDEEFGIENDSTSNLSVHVVLSRNAS